MGIAVAKRGEEMQVVVIGLDNSGKTTILNKIRDPNHIHTSAPTVGYSNKQVKLNNNTLNCVDMSGQGRYRNLWQNYYSNCNGIVFVVDSSDRLRLPVAREELELAMKSNELSDKKIPVLVLANKSDLPNAFPANKCASILDLDNLMQRPWLACSTNALSGEGLVQGFTWLSEQMVAYMDES